MNGWHAAVAMTSILIGLYGLICLDAPTQNEVRFSGVLCVVGLLVLWAEVHK